MALTRTRNIPEEGEIIRFAVKGEADPSELVESAQTRAWLLSGQYVTDPQLVLVGRDRRREVREELLDGCNHAVWGAQEDPEDRGLMIALRYMVLAYEALKEPSFD